MKSIDIREIAISHFKDGKKPAEIEKILKGKAHISTICRWISNFRNFGQVFPKVSTGRPRTARTKKLVNSVKKRLNSKSRRKSLRTMAIDFQSNQRTIRRVLTDLGKRPYRKIPVQKLKTGQNIKRKQCCTWMRKNLNSDSVRKMLFSDEKIFTSNGYFNPKNDICWADSRTDANNCGGIYEREKYPISVMVALGASWNGLTEPYFFVNGEKLNTQGYCDVLMFYKEQGDQLFKNGYWGFQQDGASSHTSKKAQEMCKNTFNFFIEKNRWPPNSPELNPLDYSIWAEISSKIDYKKVTSQAILIKEIKNAVKSIGKNYLREVIGSFLKRVYSVEKNNGELIFESFS